MNIITNFLDFYEGNFQKICILSYFNEKLIIHLTWISDKPHSIASTAILGIQVSAVYNYNGWLTEEARQTERKRRGHSQRQWTQPVHRVRQGAIEDERARGENQVQINGTVAVHPSIHPASPSSLTQFVKLGLEKCAPLFPTCNCLLTIGKKAASTPLFSDFSTISHVGKA